MAKIYYQNVPATLMLGVIAEDEESAKKIIRECLEDGDIVDYGMKVDLHRRFVHSKVHVHHANAQFTAAGEQDLPNTVDF